jgi:hypothetical protein
MMQMRILVAILIAIGSMAFSHSKPPTDIQMRRAFAVYLADQVSRTIDFIQATGGPSAVEKVKEAGNDRFEIRTFRKIECQRLGQEPSYNCTFSVDIDLANGMVRRAIEGRFYNSSKGFVFAFIEPPTFDEETEPVEKTHIADFGKWLD